MWHHVNSLLSLEVKISPKRSLEISFRQSKWEKLLLYCVIWTKMQAQLEKDFWEQVYHYLMKSVILHWLLLIKKKKKTSLESASVDECFPISSGSLNLVKVLVNDVKQHSLEREIKTQSVMQKQDDIGKTDSLQGVIKERDVQIWSCNHVKQLLSSSPATPCSLAASNTGGQWPKERDELINGRETEHQSI